MGPNSKASYSPLGNLQNDLKYLESLHQERIKHNTEFSYLLEDIKTYQAEKDDKTVSLNLKKRQEKREERKAKQLLRANARLAVLGKEPVKSLDDLPEDLEELDPFLDETAKITFDLVALGKVAKK